MEWEKFDLVVVGSGMAGLNAALWASDNNIHVLVISKLPLDQSHSTNGTGMNGIVGEHFDWKVHAYDTVKGGDYLCEQQAVEIMCSNSTKAITRMIELGVPFRKELIGKFGRAIYHTPDIKGSTCINALLSELNKRTNVFFLKNSRVIDLVTDNNTLKGLKVWDETENKVKTVISKAAILSTGPAGEIFEITTNSADCTGDGMALAWRAGATLIDMEMTQFHPTALPSGTLISESARSAGAKLKNKDGELFMKKYSPDKLELAPRDIVSRAMWTEILKSYNKNEEYKYVYLDFTSINPNYWNMQHIKKMRDDCLSELDIDIKYNEVPVAPAMHYMMGGVEIDTWAATNINGLYAAGECACSGVHGANRLGGNSLLDACVFGMRAGQAAAKYVETQEVIKVNLLEDHFVIHNSYESEITSIKKNLKSTMSLYVGIEREENNLRSAVRIIETLKYQFDSIPYTVSHLYLDTRNLLDISYLVVLGALNRKESRGTHYRKDHVERNDVDFLKHITFVREPDSKPTINYKDVTITDWVPSDRNTPSIPGGIY